MAGNLVYGFLLTQKDKVEEFGLEGLPMFNVAVKALQVSLKEIEKRSGVLFHATLHDVDVMKGSPAQPLEGNMVGFVARRRKGRR